MLPKVLREECQVVCQEVSLEECQEVWVDSQEVLQEAKDLKLMKLIDYLILYGILL